MPARPVLREKPWKSRKKIRGSGMQTGHGGRLDYLPAPDWFRHKHIANIVLKNKPVYRMDI
jgi:hypothetical protein